MEKQPPSVKAVFDQAVEIDSPAERHAYLDQACAESPDLRPKVEALLQAHDQAGSFLESPAADLQEVLDELKDQDPPGETEDQAWLANEITLDFLGPPEKPGQLGRLGHYEVQEVVGKGGMGIVLKAFDEKLHRVVAIKVMAPVLATSATARRRFVREAQAAAAVRNDHVIDIHAVEENHEPPYLVMEYIEGQSLQEWIDEKGPLELKEILRVGMQTAAGLAAAHAQGLIHRDIKPANILLENGVQRVKITDFGLARLGDDASLTQSGVVVGTPQYMSPEQAHGEAVEHRTDLFSLGSVLYTMCTGRPPFRASTTMAVLGRVSDDTPRPIREINPDIPDLLAAIISKLHAKAPAERYQTAAEVAALLGQRLAELQQPSAGPLPRQDEPARKDTRPARRAWLKAAGALLLLIGGLGLTEAIGVTHFVPVMIRAWTGADRTQAGPGEEQPAGAPLPEANTRPFVVVARAGKAAKEFATLAEAVADSNDGDTIEIRGNGPFVSDGVTVRHPLVIRAGEGYTPLIDLSQASAQANLPLLDAKATVVLEGLVLQRVGAASEEPVNPQPGLIRSLNAGPMYLANCRLVHNPLVNPKGAIFGIDGASFTLRNCELNGNVQSFGGWSYASGSRCSIENCVSAIGYVGFHHRVPHAKDVSIRVCRNTMAGGCMNLVLWTKASLQQKAEEAPPIRLNFSGNITTLGPANTQSGVLILHQMGLHEPYSAADAETLLPQLIHLEEQHNVYPRNARMLQLLAKYQPLEGTRGLDLADWRLFWNQQNIRSLEGEIRFAGGDLIAKARTAPERLTAEDYRLRPDSAGYRAGPDGKDLGADIDLVGPGPAYERWKKTPAYQEWLKATRELMAKAAAAAPLKSEPGAFVLLGGKERKFDSLEDAVLNSSAGDTIEIRSNRPIASDGVTVRHPLVIRAGQGYTPWLELSQASADANLPLVHVSAPLVMEGLVLRRGDGASPGVGNRYPPRLLKSSSDAAVQLANCRLIFNTLKPRAANFMDLKAKVFSLRNCELNGNIESVAGWYYPSAGCCSIENCVSAGGYVGFHHKNVDVEDVAIHFRGNTMVGPSLSFAFWSKPKEVGPDAPIRLDFSRNIAGRGSTQGGIVSVQQIRLDEPFSAAEAEALLPRLLRLEEEHNLYPSDARMLELLLDFKPLDGTRGLDLADWNRFWNQQDTGSVQGDVRFQGGDLAARARTDPEQLTAEDYRLRPDSAGYRAGPDGKDLGADVDLVGPGEAYERWKKTPAYQEWLKDTGQRK